MDYFAIGLVLGFLLTLLFEGVMVLIVLNHEQKNLARITKLKIGE